jgi:small subunit ribosomal protein S3
LGRKVHPYGFRLGIIKNIGHDGTQRVRDYRDCWKKIWHVRDLIVDRHERGSIADVEIERLPAARQLSVKIHTAKPGVVIGRKGASVNQLRKDLEEMTRKKVHVDVVEVDNPDLNARLIGESIAMQLERRISHKRAMKQAVRRAMKAGAEGIMITCSGRLVGPIWLVARVSVKDRCHGTLCEPILIMLM